MSSIRLGVIALAIATFAIVLINFARAHDPRDHPTLAAWAEDQQVMPAARQRFSCPPVAPNTSCSCCNGAEIVRGQFRIDKTTGADQWWWLNPKNNVWQWVPDDIIHPPEEETPDGQPVAFEYPIGSGVLRCFFAGRSDG